MGSLLAINGLAMPTPAAPGTRPLNTTNGTLAPDITKSGEIWRIRERLVGKSSLCVVNHPEFGKRVYAADIGGKLYVVDAKTGEDVCRPVKLVGTIMRSSPLYADGKLYLTTTSGWHVLEATADGVKILQRLRLSEQDEVSASPIISHGRIYLATLSNLYCIGREGQEPTAEPIPPPGEEATGENQPAHVQVIPAESLVRPGEEIQFQVKVFNSLGQEIEGTPGPVTYTVEGAGQVDGQGKFVTNTESAVATRVTAKVGSLTGLARVRVVPDLPWKFDFNDTPLAGPNNLGEAPESWIGARHRHVVRDENGERVLVKVTTIPKGTRSQAWFGHTDLHDYTIQADVKGGYNNNKLPDAGVIAQGYILDLMGESQSLQIRTWSATLRNAKTVPFAWEPDVWYTIKLHAEAHPDAAVLKGKAWKRGEPEPGAWLVEVRDESPNLRGSPGLFGNAQVSEIYIDNISVVPND
jgi:hypothetical protein